MPIATWPAQRLVDSHPSGWPRQPYPGTLIAIDGVDGSGRATQLELLALWLQVQGYGVVTTAWNSSKLVARTIREARQLNSLTPQTYSILHATDVAARQEAEIIPALRAGYIVLVDRSIFTALARDMARGVDRDWLFNLYAFGLRPDLAIYLRIDAARSIERVAGIGGEASIDEAIESATVGAVLDSFTRFQERVIDEYERLVVPFELLPIDATLPIKTQQDTLRGIVARQLRAPASAAETRAQPSHGSEVAPIADELPPHGRPGALIVVEGGDRSGRSTQVRLLVEWLEKRGQAVVQTDWSTSPHISKAIHKAKAEGALRPITYSLFYAADFADRVANVIMPALERGEVVIADRYAYTAFARDSARGADRAWLRALYAFAPRPDVVFYLRVPPGVTARRAPSAAVKARDTYELGLDLGLSADPEQSFQIYQQQVFDELEALQARQHFQTLDGQLPVDEIQRVIRDRVRASVPQCARRP
jgi:dTMP kinase